MPFIALLNTTCSDEQDTVALQFNIYKSSPLTNLLRIFRDRIRNHRHTTDDLRLAAHSVAILHQCQQQL